MKIAIIGDGGWGTALAVLLARKKFQVGLWGIFPDYVNLMKKTRVNKKFLPGIKIPDSIQISHELERILGESNTVILAVPSQYMHNVLRRIKKFDVSKKHILSVAKGLDEKKLLSMSELISGELNCRNLAVLSGPNIAYEVASAIPSAAVCASRNKQTADYFQDILMHKSFRVYTSSDVCGVELAGAFKNIIAIACGISDGLGFGTNTKAALLTRGLVEITRLGTAMGARYKTFSGLAGIGDLVTTCMNTRSRNRWLGEELGRGSSLKRFLKRTEMVAEGITTTKIALKLSKKYKISMPITQEVYNVLFKQKKPKDALSSLMLRKKKSEILSK